MLTRFTAIIIFSLSILSCSKDTPDQATVDNKKESGSKEQVVTVVDIDAGKKIFNKHCLACHGDGAGNAGTMRLAERLGDDKALLTSRDDLHPVYIKTVVREGYKLMPPFRPTEITDEQLAHLAGYLANK